MIKKRYHWVFSFVRPLFRLYSRLAKGASSVPDSGFPPDQPALILANHVTDLDPFFLATGFKRPIFFVASDHVFRLGVISSIIRFLVAPIPIVKSKTDLRAIRTINQVIAAGGLVGLFPEGNRCFNGLTGQIPPVTGKLVRRLKAPLLLYKVHGGYLTSPRWSRHGRRGTMNFELSRVLNPDELAAMTPSQVNQVIQEGIAVDAFADQHENAIPFKGKRLAEYLERVLFICPKCLGLSTMHSNDDLFSCTCGMQVQINVYGLLEPVDSWSRDRKADGAFLDNVGKWDHWQRRTLITMLDQPEHLDLTGQTPIFQDQEEVLYNCQRATRSIRLDQGKIAMYADRLEFTGKRRGVRIFPLARLDRLTVHGPQVLQFALTDGGVFELRSKRPRSAYKYVILNTLLHQKKKGEAYGFFGF
ncbi:MAG: lysophospholipid acyltransferase family protein [Saccharofermentanales bacterium]|nr:1-acyl-sn-glycerol-3-phosphate acyltransferase [Clostridiaceae bacterium]